MCVYETELPVSSVLCVCARPSLCSAEPVSVRARDCDSNLLTADQYGYTQCGVTRWPGQGKISYLTNITPGQPRRFLPHTLTHTHTLMDDHTFQTEMLNISVLVNAVVLGVSVPVQLNNLTLLWKAFQIVSALSFSVTL